MVAAREGLTVAPCGAVQGGVTIAIVCVVVQRVAWGKGYPRAREQNKSGSTSGVA